MEAYTGGENGKGPEEGGGLDFLDELRNAKREDNRVSRSPEVGAYS